MRVAQPNESEIRVPTRQCGEFLLRMRVTLVGHSVIVNTVSNSNFDSAVEQYLEIPQELRVNDAAANPWRYDQQSLLCRREGFSQQSRVFVNLKQASWNPRKGGLCIVKLSLQFIHLPGKFVPLDVIVRVNRALFDFGKPIPQALRSATKCPNLWVIRALLQDRRIQERFGRRVHASERVDNAHFSLTLGSRESMVVFFAEATVDGEFDHVVAGHI